MHGVLTMSPSGVSLAYGSKGSMHISMFLAKWLPIYKSIIKFSLTSFTYAPHSLPFTLTKMLSYVAGIAKSIWRLAKGWRNRGSNRGGGRDFSGPPPPHTARRPTEHPVECVPGLFTGGKAAEA